jgi:hypothetical protein
MVQIMLLGSKMSPPKRSSFYIEIYRETLKNGPHARGHIATVDMGLYQEIKKILLQNYKAYWFYIWCEMSCDGPLPRSFKSCQWGQN